jgi:hypothetical protein
VNADTGTDYFASAGSEGYLIDPSTNPATLIAEFDIYQRVVWSQGDRFAALEGRDLVERSSETGAELSREFVGNWISTNPIPGSGFAIFLEPEVRRIHSGTIEQEFPVRLYNSMLVGRSESFRVRGDDRLMPDMLRGEGPGLLPYIEGTMSASADGKTLILENSGSRMLINIASGDRTIE